MKKVAIILSGCGALDGSEIREAICLMLSLSQLGIKYQCFSLDKEQTFVYNHKTHHKQPNETRNILIESARLARDKIEDVSLLHSKDFHGLAFAGGYGAAVNLSDFAIKNSFDFEIDPNITRIIKDFHDNKKPMCFLCISPVLAAKLIPGVTITLGNHNDVSDGLSGKGPHIVYTDKNKFILDSKNKIITVPCYMLNITLAQLYDGIYGGVEKFSSLL